MHLIGSITWCAARQISKENKESKNQKRTTKERNRLAKQIANSCSKACPGRWEVPKCLCNDIKALSRFITETQQIINKSSNDGRNWVISLNKPEISWNEPFVAGKLWLGLDVEKNMISFDEPLADGVASDALWEEHVQDVYCM